jgi:hypothetical protein
VGEIYLLSSVAYTGSKEERAMRYELADIESLLESDTELGEWKRSSPIANHFYWFIGYRKKVGEPSCGEVVAALGPIWGYTEVLHWLGIPPEEETKRIIKEAILDYVDNRSTDFPATIGEILHLLSKQFPVGQIIYVLGDVTDERIGFRALPPCSDLEDYINLLVQFGLFREEIGAPVTLGEVLSIFAPQWGAYWTLNALAVLCREDDSLKPTEITKLVDGAFRRLRKYLDKRKSPFKPTVDEVFQFLRNEEYPDYLSLEIIAELFNQTYFFIYQQPLYIKANYGGALA